MAQQTFTVTGMTCEHCVRTVTDEMSKLAGVTDVEVDLATGRVNVRAETELDHDEVSAAVDEAGYALVR